MPLRSIVRRALNRGTAVYLGGARVRLIWPCGCSRIETLLDPRGREFSAETTARTVRWWRSGGVTLEQCRAHPDFYRRESQVERLNRENPQT